MKILVLLLLATAASSKNLDEITDIPTAFGYIEDVAIPLGAKIREAEEENVETDSKIVGGSPAQLGQYRYQAGLLGKFVGIEGTGICSGSLISTNRVATAAHCWYDGRHQGWKMTVVLGSTKLFSGGKRLDTSAVVTHPKWLPLLLRNDVAVVYLPEKIRMSDTIAPIALPSGDDLNEDFNNIVAIASGFGLTDDKDTISTSQSLYHVQLNVISNKKCSLAFPSIIKDTHICTSGLGGVGVCSGDSGGPLAVTRNDNTILIGITSFGSRLGCKRSIPNAYSRVTAFVDFFNEHMK